jgi:hypothetical protein
VLTLQTGELECYVDDNGEAQQVPACAPNITEGGSHE